MSIFFEQCLKKLHNWRGMSSLRLVAKRSTRRCLTQLSLDLLLLPPNFNLVLKLQVDGSELLGLVTDHNDLGSGRFADPRYHL